MNNERYYQIIDEVYGQFRKYKMENLYDTQWDVIIEMNVSDKNKPYFVTGRILTQEEFINKIKTDQEFSERWGLKIEERELSLDERNDWFQINRNGNNPLMKSDWKDYELDQQNIPKRAITLTYNNETIKVYE